MGPILGQGSDFPPLPLQQSSPEKGSIFSQECQCMIRGRPSSVSDNSNLMLIYSLIFTRDALRGIPCLKTGRFLFFLCLHINLFIKLYPLLVGIYCSDCIQQKQANQNPFLSRISRGRGPTHPYLCDVKASFDLFIKTGLN